MWNYLVTRSSQDSVTKEAVGGHEIICQPLVNKQKVFVAVELTVEVFFTAQKCISFEDENPLLNPTCPMAAHNFLYSVKTENIKYICWLWTQPIYPLMHGKQPNTWGIPLTGTKETPKQIVPLLPDFSCRVVSRRNSDGHNSSTSIWLQVLLTWKPWSFVLIH